MMQHTEEKLFACSSCEKKVAFILKEHAVIHTGETIYHCSISGQSYNKTSNISGTLDVQLIYCSLY